VDLPLEPGIRFHPELLPALLALAAPGAIRLPGQSNDAADQLSGNSVKRDGDELFFHCLPPSIKSFHVLISIYLIYLKKKAVC
jgi:hypothetical protein